METVTDFIFMGSKYTADGDCSHNIKRRLLLGRKAMTNLDNILKRHYFADKGQSSQSYVFSSSHVWMWELDYEESWVPKNWCFWTVLLEKTLESPLDCKEIQPVHPKRNQSWISIGRTDVEAEAPILQPPDVKNWLIWKDPDAGKDWRQEEKGMTEDENGWMVSLTQWTWDWASSGSCWWIGRPGVLQSLGLQRIRHDWATELMVSLGFCDGSDSKGSVSSARDPDLIPGLGISPRAGNGYPLQYSCLENFMHRGTW